MLTSQYLTCDLCVTNVNTETKSFSKRGFDYNAVQLPSKVQKIKGFPPLMDLRREVERSRVEQTEIENIKAALYSLSILKKHRDWFSEA